MIGRTDLIGLNAAQRADLIYRGTRSELDDRLWRAALGSAADAPPPTTTTARLDLEALVRSLSTDMTLAGKAPANLRDETDFEQSDGKLNLGPNSPHAGAITAAATRTGIPAAALSAIVDAEAAKGADGRWNPLSRNPRSSAAGLGQFLSSTWIGEAQRPGTWLHAEAGRRGWLDTGGHVRAEHWTALLALRYEPAASIEATADFARNNLDRLERAGASIAGDIASTARAAYLAHHLGARDAVRFLRGGLSDARAATLLTAQVGSAAAASRIAAAGEPVAAHRQWLTAYVDRRIRPEKFLA